MIEYIPQYLEFPLHQTKKYSAWKANALVIKDITNRFVKDPNLLLEFGVEYGYSTAVFSSYFKNVIGVDTFKGDENSGIRSDGFFEETKALLINYPNIQLIQASYQDFIATNNDRYDAIHVDIVHTYEDTYACGKWAVEHSDVVMFHDTLSFEGVRRSCEDLSKEYGFTFYNYNADYGLGILVKSL